ncbi:MAG: (d)CMP kinase, partial [Parachlamydiaceae bacterium]
FPEEAQTLTQEQVLKEIEERDTYDMTREASPLKQAEDAFIVDTSDLTIDEIVLKILECKDSIKTRHKA